MNLFEKKEIGLKMLHEYHILKSETDDIMIEKMKEQNNINYAIAKISGDYLTKESLIQSFNKFEIKYNEIVINSLSDSSKSEENIKSIASNCKKLVADLEESKTKWTLQIRDSVGDVLAHLFTIWTLLNIHHCNQTREIAKDKLYLRPHVGQMLAIFRMLGIGYEKTFSDSQQNESNNLANSVLNMLAICNQDFNANKLLYNNMIQVGTGEGKSVIVAIAACVLALFGADVNCTCYSDYLITRDKKHFEALFDTLGVTDRIHYGTFNQLCEAMLNEKFDLRKKVSVMISENLKDMASINNEKKNNSSQRAKVLIVDEVDVFLSDQFYGGTYQPSCWIKSDVIVSLFDEIWKNSRNRTTPLRTRLVTKMSSYKECLAKYSNYVYIFEEAIKDMLTTLKSYDRITYSLKDDKIAYVDGENITSSVTFGYNTVWHYYLENEKGNITRESLVNNIGIMVNCGLFSYAEMPFNFAFISGVSGTLSSLANKEKTILKDTYNIHTNTYIGSIFGQSKLSFDPDRDVKVFDQSNYFSSIKKEIDVVFSANRSILIFFEDIKHLKAFNNYPELESIKDKMQVLTVTEDPKEKQIKVNRATEIGRVTLVTCAMGRGTDFICRSTQLIANGGIHVLQTFFSKEESEEIQIKGRAARQGEPGSYRMILLDSDLVWLLGSELKDHPEKAKDSKLYQHLSELRAQRYEKKCDDRETSIDQCKRDHNSSINFINAMINNEMGVFNSFLKEKNKGFISEPIPSRTILLMDATDSMNSVLPVAKETVCTMFQRASQILNENDSFFMQFALYRNYNVEKSDFLLQSSQWETNAEHLRAFMDNKDPEGGLGEEAIEIGLWHAVNESEQEEGVSQVILIGDMPAQSKEQVIARRQKHHSEDYWNSKFGKPTDFEEQLNILFTKQIPVHAFYLHEDAKKNFEEIALKTGGRCEKLDIQSEHGAEMLTDFITKEVLRISGGKDKGSELVSLYEKKYPISYM